MSELKEYDISKEAARTIIWPRTGAAYVIHQPKTLFIRPGGTTHRVVDEAGIVHCYPAPETGLTVIQWQPMDKDKPVQF